MGRTRILHIVNSMGQGGIENVIMNLYRNLDREKVQFDFLMPEGDKGFFDDEIEALGGKIYRISASNKLNEVKEIFNFIKSHKDYKALHVHYLNWGVVALMAAKFYGWKHRISHIHYAGRVASGFNLDYIVKTFIRQLVRSTTSHYFACSNTAGLYYFGKRNVKKSNYRVLNNAIDINKFNYKPETRASLRRELGIEDNTLVLGQVSRLHKIKNPAFTIDVLNSLRKRGVDAKCIFVGDGELRKELEEYSASLGCSDYCIFVGSVDNPYDYMQAMDALVFPSKVEGLGMVAIEAQATGLKCFNSTGVPEECSISDLTYFIPLAEGPEKWGDLIARERHYKRESRVENVTANGYNIVSVAKGLEDFYLNLD